MREQPDLGDYSGLDALLSIVLILVFIGLIFALIGITGCTPMEQLEREYAASERIAQYQKEAAEWQRATVVISGKCTTGCDFSAEYTDPRDRIMVTGVDVMSNNEAWVTAAPEIKSILTYGILGYSVYKVTKNMNNGDGNTNTTNSNLISSSGGDVNVTNDNGFAGPISSDTKSLSFSEMVDSHDIDNTDNTDIFSSYNNTAPPVIVTQPPPVVVTP